MVPRTRTVLITVLAGVAAASCTSSDSGSDGGAPEPAAAVEVCGNDAVLGDGPVQPPAGAVVVPAGDNSSLDFAQPDTTFWFAPGTHTFGADEFGQVVAGDGSRYVGAPGAVLDGGNVNRYAITAARGARDVTVEHLTIENFGAEGTNLNEGVVNQGAGADWTIRYNTVRDNAGAGLILGSGNVAEHNCLTRNGQYGFNAASPEGPTDLRVAHNEISYNNTDDWDARIEGCGCTGGGKFWFVKDAEVTDNYVHHNIGVGIWADTNNRGFLFQGNILSENTNFGILYETSYNAVIRDNVFVRNGLVAGPNNPTFPTGAVYISESGGDSRVAGRFRGRLEVTGNRFTDNWSGVVLWENADRFCGSPANSSTGICTLADPGLVTVETCGVANIGQEPYYDDCRWRTRQVRVHGNVFEHDPTRIGSQCTPENGCGLNAVLSNAGGYPDWSPYRGPVVQQEVTYDAGNAFFDNVYVGPWHFLPFEQGNVVTFGQWRDEPYGQDRGSTMTSGGPGSDPEAVAEPSGDVLLLLGQDVGVQRE